MDTARSRCSEDGGPAVDHQHPAGHERCPRGEPVMNDRAGLARNTTAGAISSGSAARCCGASSTQWRLNCGWSIGVMSVRTYPGATALTRTPYGAHSAASDFVRWCTAALEAL